MKCKPSAAEGRKDFIPELRVFSLNKDTVTTASSPTAAQVALTPVDVAGNTEAAMHKAERSWAKKFLSRNCCSSSRQGSQYFAHCVPPQLSDSELMVTFHSYISAA